MRPAEKNIIDHQNEIILTEARGANGGTGGKMGGGPDMIPMGPISSMTGRSGTSESSRDKSRVEVRVLQGARQCPFSLEKNSKE